VYAGLVLNRLRASRSLRAGLLYATIAFCGYGVYAEWPQVSAALGRMQWYSVAGAAVTAAAGWACNMLAWREVVTDLGSRLSLPASVRIMSVTQLAKYLPGAVWAFAAQVELGREYRVPRRRGASAVAVSLALTLGVALATAAIVLPLASAGAAREYWWALAIAPVIVVCMWPPVLGRLLDRALTLARRQPLERRPSTAGILKALAWTVLGWLFWGLQAWLLIRNLTGLGVHALPIAIGGYALAWSAGVLIVPAPGGVGARELALIAVLAPIMPRGAALAVALVSRVVMTGSDVAWGAAGVAARRFAPGTAPEQAPDRRGRHRKPWRPRLPAPAWLLGEAGSHVRTVGPAGLRTSELAGIGVTVIAAPAAPAGPEPPSGRHRAQSQQYDPGRGGHHWAGQRDPLGPGVV
jgi:glycosyltransferase 2 family protein